MIFKRGRKRGKGGYSGKHKFCPVCGLKAELPDAYCTNCGYSFAERGKKSGTKVKWKNLILVVILILIIYFVVRYLNGLSIIPVSLGDAFNLSILKGSP